MYESDNLRFYSLDWDSNYFKINAAKAVLKKETNKAEQAKLLKLMSEYDFVSISNLYCNAQNSIFLGEHTSAFIIDTNIQFEKRIKSKPERPDNITIQNKYPGHESIFSLAEFSESKFLKDPKLRTRGGEKVYVEWLKNTFNRADKYFSLSFDHNGSVNGYVLHSFNDSECIIELIAVDKNSQGLGLGKKLFESVEYSVIQNGVTLIRVGTQILNKPAINFYHKNGCSYVESSQTYHLWNM